MRGVIVSVNRQGFRLDNIMRGLSLKKVQMREIFAVGSTMTLLIDSQQSDKPKKGVDENQITVLRQLVTDIKSIKIDQ